VSTVPAQLLAAAASSGSPFYVTGGTPPTDAALLDGLLDGEFCDVLKTRHMGTSSLMISTVAKLREQGVTVAVLDRTAVGQNVSPEQWSDEGLVMLAETLHFQNNTAGTRKAL
jgi:hypothetical protein